MCLCFCGEVVYCCSIFFTCSPIREGLQQSGACCDGRTAGGSLHEACSGRWDGSVEVLLWPFPFLLVGVRKLSLLAEGEAYFSRHPCCGCRTASRTSTGDGCLFLLEPRRAQCLRSSSRFMRPKRIRAPGRPAAPKHLEKVKIPTVLSKAEHSPNEQWRNLRQEYEQKFELCSETGLKLVER